jgi:hypothetical protein
MFRSVLAIVLMISPAIGGELTKRDIRRYTEWEPTGCNKPNEPNFYVSDVSSFNRAVEEYNNYAREVETYIQCVDTEASDDFRTLKNILQDSVSSQSSNLKTELETVKSNLERQRP